MLCILRGWREAAEEVVLVISISLLNMKCTLAKYGDHPTVDNQRVTSHVGSRARTQPKHSVSGFFRPSDPSERDHLREACFRSLGILRRNPLEDTSQHGSVKTARHQRVDANSLFCVFLGGGLCESKHARLGGGV